MAKGDFGAAMGIGAPSSRGTPLDLATIIARLRATQGGGQMGPGQLGGGMMPNMQPSGMAPNVNPGGQQMPMQARPMFGGFQPQMSMPAPSRMMSNPFNPANNTGIAGNMDEVNQTRKLQYLG